MASLDLIQIFLLLLAIIGIALDIYYVGGALYMKYTQWLNFRHFVKVFGSAAQDPNNIRILIPEWHLTGEKNKDQIRFTKSLLNPADKEFTEFHGPTITVAYKDLDSICLVAPEIYKAHPGNPINYSLDTVEEWDNRSGKTMIMIGSIVANAHYRYLMQQNEVPYFEEYFTNQQMGFENPCYPAAVAYRDKQTRIEYHSVDKLPIGYVNGDELIGDNYPCELEEKGSEEYSSPKKEFYESVPDPKHYALISRFPNTQGKGGYFFVIEGPHAEGTLAASRYFSKNWINFIKAEQKASILLQIDYKLQSGAKAVKRYGFPATEDSVEYIDPSREKPRFSKGIIFPNDK